MTVDQKRSHEPGAGEMAHRAAGIMIVHPAGRPATLPGMLVTRRVDHAGGHAARANNGERTFPPTYVAAQAVTHFVDFLAGGLVLPKIVQPRSSLCGVRRIWQSERFATLKSPEQKICKGRFVSLRI
jgi:hypothetical protein